MAVTMNNVRLQHTSPPRASAAPAGPRRRLIVLIPTLELEPVLAARRLCELADAADAQILFLGICNDAAQEPGHRRQLILLSGMVSGGGVLAHTELVTGKGWLEAVRARREPEDMLVCFAEHRVGPMQRPISQLLQSGSDAPLYILSGMAIQHAGKSSKIASVVVWLGLLAIVAAVFMLQIQIDDLSQGWARTALLLISLFVGAGAIWVWNSLFE